MFPLRVLWERWSPGSHLETPDSKVCDLVLRLVDGRAHLVAPVEEDAE
jgi:hypothetical protein